MKKSHASLTILGSILIFLTSVVVTYFTLLAVGVIDAKPIEVTIAIENSSKEYDGTPLTASSYHISEGKLVEGHKISISYNDYIVNVGEISSTADIKILDKEGYDVTSKYLIKQIPGVLSVTKRIITLEVNKEKIYDGKALNINEDDYLITGGSLVVGHKFLSKVLNDVVDIDSSVSNTSLIPSVYDVNGYDVSDNYSITVGAGNVVINKQVITLSSDSLSKVYDGNEISCNQYEIKTGSIASTHIINVTFDDNKLVDVGSSYNRFSVMIVDNNNLDVSKNYDIRYEYGMLEITPLEIEVSASSDTKIYDGTPLNSSIYPTITKGALLSNHTLDYEYKEQVNDLVGTYVNDFESIKIYSNGVDVTKNYLIKHNVGNIEITKRDIVVEAKSENFTFTGKKEEFKEFEDVSNLVLDHMVECEFSEDSYILEVGKKPNVIKSVKVVDMASTDLSSNYNIIIVEGLLTMSPCKIKLTTESEENIEYDGNPHELLVYNFDNNIINELDYKVVINDNTVTSITNVGKKDNIFTVSIFDGGKDVSSNFVIEYEYGKLEVKPKNIIIKTDSLSKVYDGNKLVPNSASSDGLVKGHKIVGLSFEGEALNVSDNNSGKLVDYIIVDGLGFDVTDNYVVSEILTGELTITPKDIYIVGKSVDLEYNGYPQNYTHNDYESVEGLLFGDYLSVNYDPNSTSTYVFDSNELIINSIEIVNLDGEDITNNYKPYYKNGNINITPAALVVSNVVEDSVYGDDYDTQVYTKLSGLTDIDDDVVVINEVLYKQFIDGRWVKLTNIPKDAGTYSVEILDASILNMGNDVSSCYDLSFEVSEFEIKPKDIYIMLADINPTSVIYSGKAYDDVVAYTKSTETVNGDNFSVSVSFYKDGIEVSPVDAGVYSVSYLDFKMINGKKSNYNVICENEVSLTINKKIIEGNVKNSSKVYDGQKLYATELENIVGLVNGHEIMPKFKGDVTDYSDVGTPAVLDTLNSRVYDMLGNDVTDNYDLSHILAGILTINKRDITIYGKNVSFVYTGSDISYTGTDFDYVDGMVLNHEVKSVTYDAHSYIDVYMVDGKISSQPINITNHVIDDVYANNYNVKYMPGSLTITPKDVHISINEDLGNFVYEDGKVHVITGNEFSSDTLVSDMKIKVTYQDSTGNLYPNGVTNAGVYTVIYQDFEASKKDNYTVICDNTSKLVVKINISVTPLSQEYFYDTLEHGLTEVEDVLGLLSGHSFKILDSDKLVTPDTKTCNITDYVILDEDGLDVTYLYSVKLNEANVVVHPAKLSIYLPNSKSKEYDGEVLAVDASDVKVFGLLPGHYFEIYSYGITEPADSTLEYVTYSIFDCNDNEIDDYYDIYCPVEYTALTIYKKTINVYTESLSKVYDGTELTSDNSGSDGYWFDESVVINNMEYPSLLVDEYPSIVNVGSIQNSIKFVEDDYYTYNVIPGTLTITPRTLVVRTSSESKVYDGYELTGSYKLIGDDVDLIDVTLSGVITNVGSVMNSIESITVNSGTEGLANYEIIYDIGTLTITPCTLVITTLSDTKVYDGDVLTADYSYDGLAATDSIDISVSSGITNVGTISNTVEYLMINDDIEAMSNYNIVYNLGTLTVTPRSVSIDVNQATGYVSTSGLANGEDIIVDVNLKNVDGSDVYVVSNIIFVNANQNNYVLEINYY